METGEHTSELGEWQTVQRAADPRLRAYVHGYFASSSDLRTPVLERHLPSAEVPLLVNFGAPHRRSDDSGEWSTRDGAWVVGLHARHQLTQAVGERHFMVVRFTPIGAHLFLGLPMHSIANESIELEQIDAALARALMRRVGLARSWTDRFAAMESLIAQRVAEAEMPGSVDAVWRRLVATDGRDRARFTRRRTGLQSSHVDCAIPNVRWVSAEDGRAAAALQSRRALARLLEPHAGQRDCWQAVHRIYSRRRSTGGCNPMGRHRDRLRLLRSGASHQGFPRVRRQHT